MSVKSTGGNVRKFLSLNFGNIKRVAGATPVGSHRRKSVAFVFSHYPAIFFILRSI